LEEEDVSVGYFGCKFGKKENFIDMKLGASSTINLYNIFLYNLVASATFPSDIGRPTAMKKAGILLSRRFWFEIIIFISIKSNSATRSMKRSESNKKR